MCIRDRYKAARYSKKYLAQHEAELATYRAAKDTMNTILNGAQLPKIEALKKSRRELAGQKKALYAESVSYTHLDVYKRQSIIRILFMAQLLSLFCPSVNRLFRIFWN